MLVFITRVSVVSIGGRCRLLLVFILGLVVCVRLRSTGVLIAGRFVGAVVRRGQFVLGVGRIHVQGRPLVPTNLGLALPIALIQHSNKLLERAQFGGLANVCDLILETLWETFIILAGQGNFVSNLCSERVG